MQTDQRRKLGKLAPFYKKLIAFIIGGLVLMVGLVVTAFALARSSQQFQEPEQIAVNEMISLSPTYGGANTLVNITGMGYPTNARVALYLSPAGGAVGAQPNGEALTNADGMFSVMFQMPTAWLDGAAITQENLTITALAQFTAEDGVVEDFSAAADFHYLPVVQPEISISPNTGGEGTLTTITSTGFPANQAVNIAIGMRDGTRPSTQVYASGVADANGVVTLSLSMPEFWPDGSRIRDEQLEIVASTADGATRASAGFDYIPVPYPLISVSPNYGGPDTAVTIIGDGFPAGANVLIKLGTSVDDAASKPAYVQVSADLQGNISIPFIMPGYWPGGLPILVRDVVVLATTGDGRGYGWMGFAYLTHVSIVEQVTGVDLSGNAETQTPPVETPASGSSVAVDPTVETVPTEGPTVVINPAIALAPASGPAGTRVAVTGSGFPADTALAVRLGLPATGLDNTDYATLVSDSAGYFQTEFIMPAQWPDGAPIVETGLVVVVTNPDGSARAAADYLFTAAVPTEEPTTAVSCAVSDVIAAMFSVPSTAISSGAASVVDPAVGTAVDGCRYVYNVISLATPFDAIRAGLTAAGWVEDPAYTTGVSAVYRSSIGMLILSIDTGVCVAPNADATCSGDMTFAVTVDLVETVAP